MAGEPKRVEDRGDFCEGLQHLRALAEAHPGRLDPLLLEDDVDCNLEFAKAITKEIESKAALLVIRPSAERLEPHFASGPLSKSLSSSSSC